MRLVKVTWLDAQFSLDDTEIEPVVMQTVGYLLEQDEGEVRVASEKGGDILRGITVIPTCCVQYVTGLRDGTQWTAG